VDLVERMVAAVATASPAVVLVPHSNAGLAASVVGARTVFVDAAIPLSAGDTAIAPAGLLAHLERLADDDGLLPPWTQWWDDLTGIFPDAATQAVVEAEQPQLPMSYFRARLRVPDGWAAAGRCTYLAFGDTYADEVTFARASGWPVRVLPGRHLHQLHDPAGVGAAVVDLAKSLTR
jgi:hypothetical protein